SLIRQTKKIQYLVDTSEEPISDIHEEQLNVRVIHPNGSLSYNDEQFNNAMLAMDEAMQTHIDRFMKYFEELQAEHTKEITH
ncbi:MAG TPA: hypothetical protein VK048_05840, partial [Atopostipes sp.]|nr:hypothetical protein [Atopostipes sp.]